VLLGANGAGKTTTVAMLIGMLEPSSGTAAVAGFDVVHQQQEMRRRIGVCTQHDVFFQTLTAMEHLTLFAQVSVKHKDWKHNDVYK
jgi:ABC-type multidrug transport system ATPase subunit